MALEIPENPEITFPVAPRPTYEVVRAGFYLVFYNLQGGWCVYQCLETDRRFRSENYAPRLHRCGDVTVVSRNSPWLELPPAPLPGRDSEGPIELGVHGAFREFDLKPVALRRHVRTEEITKMEDALMSLSMVLDEEEGGE